MCCLWQIYNCLYIYNVHFHVYIHTLFTDAATVGFSQTTFTLAEGASQSVCVDVTAGTLGRDVMLTVTQAAGTATGGFIQVTTLCR